MVQPKPAAKAIAVALEKSPLQAKDRKLALRCAEAIRRLYPEAEVIIYGSRARGKPKADSDLDLLVLTDRKLNVREEMFVMDTVYPIELESGLIICPMVEEKNRWYSDKYQVMPIARAIAKEGVKL